MRYGEIATIAPNFREQFQAGAFGEIRDLILNRQHDRGLPVARQGKNLRVNDTGSELRIEADLNAEITHVADTIRMVKDGLLQGMSIEFGGVEASWAGDLRTVTRAVLTGVGVVDRPAYEGSQLERVRTLENPVSYHFVGML